MSPMVEYPIGLGQPKPKNTNTWAPPSEARGQSSEVEWLKRSSRAAAYRMGHPLMTPWDADTESSWVCECLACGSLLAVDVDRVDDPIPGQPKTFAQVLGRAHKEACTS